MHASAADHRRSVRQFEAAAIPEAELRELLRLAGRAPSAFNAQPWRFIVVGDAILSAYESATGRYRGQDTILRRDERHYSARGTALDGGKILSAWSFELRLV